MKNPFKQLETDKEVPDQIKQRVMNDVRLVYLMGDVTDLFTAKMLGTISKFIGGTEDDNESPKIGQKQENNSEPKDPDN